ncbi:C2H2 finger domain-containing protein [Drepanopeziza brunnea f. sp. 'multigermtubi' MB_m1]|uniref:C2H2 finger domain-containing protein n=1 Tax=Marssonina brunnea f. sp. multigermtubi (strain MB_m1) TaxID=1072389 RepID=K1XYC5_MARBU|nr:C2H2 finger domain-containing protein [Drepanopeziza brunnea f. sp. 'multigermtubi' MB_m1]EKD17824.1 C2H2 finger domain-containing protein [Drepanopeziza brunnea f. sp. 'multigermtubi' MB_m1]
MSRQLKKNQPVSTEILGHSISSLTSRTVFRWTPAQTRTFVHFGTHPRTLDISLKQLDISPLYRSLGLDPEDRRRNGQGVLIVDVLDPKLKNKLRGIRTKAYEGMEKRGGGGVKEECMKEEEEEEDEDEMDLDEEQDQGLSLNQRQRQGLGQRQKQRQGQRQRQRQKQRQRQGLRSSLRLNRNRESMMRDDLDNNDDNSEETNSPMADAATPTPAPATPAPATPAPAPAAIPAAEVPAVPAAALLNAANAAPLAAGRDANPPNQNGDDAALFAQDYNGNAAHFNKGNSVEINTPMADARTPTPAVLAAGLPAGLPAGPATFMFGAANAAPLANVWNFNPPNQNQNGLGNDAVPFFRQDNNWNAAFAEMHGFDELELLNGVGVGVGIGMGDGAVAVDGAVDPAPGSAPAHALAHAPAAPIAAGNGYGNANANANANPLPIDIHANDNNDEQEEIPLIDGILPAPALGLPPAAGFPAESPGPAAALLNAADAGPLAASGAQFIWNPHLLYQNGAPFLGQDYNWDNVYFNNKNGEEIDIPAFAAPLAAAAAEAPVENPAGLAPALFNADGAAAGAAPPLAAAAGLPAENPAAPLAFAAAPGANGANNAPFDWDQFNIPNQNGAPFLDHEIDWEALFNEIRDNGNGNGNGEERHGRDGLELLNDVDNGALPPFAIDGAVDDALAAPAPPHAFAGLDPALAAPIAVGGNVDFDQFLIDIDNYDDDEGEAEAEEEVLNDGGLPALALPLANAVEEENVDEVLGSGGGDAQVADQAQAQAQAQAQPGEFDINYDPTIYVFEDAVNARPRMDVSLSETSFKTPNFLTTVDIPLSPDSDGSDIESCVDTENKQEELGIDSELADVDTYVDGDDKADLLDLEWLTRKEHYASTVPIDVDTHVGRDEEADVAKRLAGIKSASTHKTYLKVFRLVYERANRRKIDEKINRPQESSEEVPLVYRGSRKRLADQGDYDEAKWRALADPDQVHVRVHQDVSRHKRSLRRPAHIEAKDTLILPEIIFNPSLTFRPHVALLSLIFADNAFLAPGLMSAERIRELEIPLGCEQLPLRLKPEIATRPTHRVPADHSSELPPIRCKQRF